MALSSLQLKIIVNACVYRFRSGNFGEDGESLDEIVDSYTKLSPEEKESVKQQTEYICITQYGMEVPPEKLVQSEDEDQDSIH